MMRIRNRFASALAVICLVLLGACEAQYRSHGYIPPEEDLDKLVIGVDTRAAVDDVIGPPSASGLLSDGDYYYVRSRFREYGMFEPQVVDRRFWRSASTRRHDQEHRDVSASKTAMSCRSAGG